MIGLSGTRPSPSVRSSGWLPTLVPAVVAAAVYLPDALRRSAWSDDFPLMEGDAIAKMYADGRPVLALLYETVFPDHITGLAGLRAIGVLGIAALASLLTVLLIRWGAAAWNAALWSISAILLPPFHTYAAWATVFAVPWFSLIAVAAGAFWIKDDLTDNRGGQAAAILGMTLAMLAYPPAAMFCWVPLGLKILVTRSRPGDAYRSILRLGWLVFGTGLAALLIAPIARSLRGVPVDARVQVMTSLHEMVEKVIWFVSHPVVVAARPFVIKSPDPLPALVTAGPILGMTAAGLLLAFNGSIRSRFITLSAVASCCALTMAPHLIVPDNQIEYRFMGGLTVLMWGCICVASHHIFQLSSVRLATGVRHSFAPIGRRLLPAIGYVMVLPLTAMLAISNIRQTFIDPSISKEAYLFQALDGYDPSVHRQILILNHQETWMSRTNLGIYSTTSDLAHGWVAEPNIRILLLETDRSSPAAGFRTVRDDVQAGVLDHLVDLRPYAGSFGP